VRILLDTCTFLWVAVNAKDLSARARELFVDPSNNVYLSVASAWEIAVKSRLGKLQLPEPVEQYIPALRERHGVESLPLDEEAALHEARLPPLHRDPFDRMLVSQGIVHGMVILTPDSQIQQYPVRTTW
jgi:PIN domain nuclease of toxin-antitoxin system